MNRQIAFPVTISLVLSLLGPVGCSLAPEYTRPGLPVTDAWPENTPVLPPQNAFPGATNADQIGWRDFFTDPPLQHLLGMALENNRDLRIAALNIERARAMYRIQWADLLPHVSGTGAGQVQGLPADLSQTGQAGVTRQYSAGLSSNTFELDFFGRIKSLTDEALEQYLATEEARRSAHIALLSEVAGAYLTLVADRERLNIAQETLTSQRASYEMIKRRYNSGVSSELDLKQAQTSVDNARVDIAKYSGQLARDTNALSLLVGAPLPKALLPATKLDDLTRWQDLPAALPSEVLLKRPDIVQYEHLLQAANANIGAARAKFFPSITLTAFGGTASKDISNLFDGGTGMWNFLPSLNLPIFTAGQNIANLRMSEADRDIAVAKYEKAIQTAFQEVADALDQRSTLADQLEAQASLLNATSDAYRLSNARYQSGVDSYLNVLDSQRTMYAAQIGLVTIRASKDMNLIMLYKALGGGWLERTTPIAEQVNEEETAKSTTVAP